MIRINLLPQKRAKRQAVASEPSSKQLLYGVGALLGAGALVFFLVDKPKRDKVHDLEEKTAHLQDEINTKNLALAGFDQMKKDEKDAVDRAQAISRLISAKVVPAHVLHELGKILTQNDKPTMTRVMIGKTGGDTADPSKKFDPTWDPTHVWLSSFSDASGAFRLEGGAQSSSDVTQLSKRLQASIYFPVIDGISSEPVQDRDNGLNYVKFTITGKVAY